MLLTNTNDVNVQKCSHDVLVSVAAPSVEEMET